MNNEIMNKVFNWFGIGLLITFGVGYLASTNLQFVLFLAQGSTCLIIGLIEIFCAIYLGARVNKMSPTTAKTLYIIYTALTGLTFSAFFIVYQITSIIWVFLATSIIFLIFAFIGKTTKINLNKIAIYLLVGLFSVMILELINLFFLNGTLDMTLCIVSIIIFCFYIAYDMQKISRLTIANDNLAIIGAFNLYLDFINIFIRLLQFFGKQRD